MTVALPGTIAGTGKGQNAQQPQPPDYSNYTNPLYTGYVPDVDYLRNMPVNIPASWQQYANIAEQIGQYLTQTPAAAAAPQYQYIQEAIGAKQPVGQYGQIYTGVLGTQLPEARGSQTYQQLQQQYQQHISYLSDIPGLSAIDAPYLTSAFENIDRTYDTARQRVLQEYARRGIEPSSGIVQSELRKIEEARAADKARAQRDLAMWKIQEQRSRLAEARGLSAALEQLERARMAEERGIAGALAQSGISTILQQLGLQQQAAAYARGLEDWLTGRALQALPIFQQIPQITQALDQLERARRAEARSIEAMMDEVERQRIFDMLALLSGSMPPTAGISAAGGLAGLASNLAAMLNQQAGAGWSTLGQMLGQLLYPVFTGPTPTQPSQQPATGFAPKVFTGGKDLF